MTILTVTEKMAQKSMKVSFAEKGASGTITGTIKDKNSMIPSLLVINKIKSNPVHKLE